MKQTYCLYLFREEQEELGTQYETVHKIAEDLKRQLAEVEGEACS